MRFTHVDPFEDTESSSTHPTALLRGFVSPTSIRSRILKGRPTGSWGAVLVVSPTSIRSRILKGSLVMADAAKVARFTHVDPFEDTESNKSRLIPWYVRESFTHVDPFEDTERLWY